MSSKNIRHLGMCMAILRQHCPPQRDSCSESWCCPYAQEEDRGRAPAGSRPGRHGARPTAGPPGARTRPTARGTAARQDPPGKLDRSGLQRSLVGLRLTMSGRAGGRRCCGRGLTGRERPRTYWEGAACQACTRAIRGPSNMAHHTLERSVTGGALGVADDAVGIKVALVKHALLARGQTVAIRHTRACVGQQGVFLCFARRSQSSCCLLAAALFNCK